MFAFAIYARVRIYCVQTGDDKLSFSFWDYLQLALLLCVRREYRDPLVWKFFCASTERAFSGSGTNALRLVRVESNNTFFMFSPLIGVSYII